MRIGLISDIHGNLLALEAVLEELAREGIDKVVCLGDVAVGPQPSETLARIKELGCPVVMGNWDAAFISGMPEPRDEVGEMLVEIGNWWAGFLSLDDRTFMETFEPTVDLMLGSTPALAFHGSPKSYDDWIFSTTPDDELAPMFGDERPQLLVGGHTHVQLARRWGSSLIVNPGSVGLPFLAWWPERVRVAPWAEYGIVSADDGRLQVDLRRTTFDVDAHLRLSRASGMPHAEWWADCWVV